MGDCLPLQIVSLMKDKHNTDIQEKGHGRLLCSADQLDRIFSLKRHKRLLCSLFQKYDWLLFRIVPSSERLLMGVQ